MPHSENQENNHVTTANFNKHTIISYAKPVSAKASLFQRLCKRERILLHRKPLHFSENAIRYNSWQTRKIPRSRRCVFQSNVSPLHSPSIARTSAVEYVFPSLASCLAIATSLANASRESFRDVGTTCATGSACRMITKCTFLSCASRRNFDRFSRNSRILTVRVVRRIWV